MIIYKISNTINGKAYVGQTVRSLEKRFKGHITRSGCKAIHGAIKKYGKDSFKIEEIDTATSKEELDKKENYWIVELNTLHPNGYNLNSGVSNRIWSEKTKLEMSEAHKNKTLTQEHKDNISKGVKEQILKNPEKFKTGALKIVELNKGLYSTGYHPKRGKKLSTESKKRISEAKKGTKNPMYGKKLNEEQLEVFKKERQRQLDARLKVLCHQNNTIYDGVTEAAKDLGFARSSVSNVLIGFRKNLRGYTFEYVKKEDSET